MLSCFSHILLFAALQIVASVHGILQARILEWLLYSSPGDLPNSETEPVSLMSPALAGGFFTTSTTWAQMVKTQLLSTFCLLEHSSVSTFS